MFSAFQTFGRLGAGGLPFSERALWPQGASSPGLWIDPSYSPSEFQDSAGTTALSTVGTVLDSSNPVGLVLDRKGGLQLGAEMVPATYSGSTDSPWAITATSVTRNGATSGIARFDLSSAISTSKYYQVTGTVSGMSGDTIGIRVGPGGTPYNISSNGDFVFHVIGSANGAALYFIPWVGDAGQATITNISVREIPGLHLSQSTSAARPVASGRKNLLVGTDTLATQSVTVIAAQCVLSFTGTGTVTLSGVSTAGPLVGTGASDRVSLTFTPTAGSLTLTVSGSVTLAQLEYRA